MKRNFWGCVVAILLVVGCVATPDRPAAPFLSQVQEVPYVSFDETLTKYLPYWAAEANKKYPLDSFALVAGHGDSREDVWVVDLAPGATVPVATLVQVIRERHPDLRLILIICNPGHHDLHEPGVSYAKHNVWAVPDSFQNMFHNLERDLKYSPAYVGSIDEFVEVPWEPIVTVPGGPN
jgi:hypothetical protein